MTGGSTPDDLVPGATLPERRVHARNLFRDAANRIHDDAVARQYGYAGALVAGVTIYGYLSRLAVATWGLEWLRRGTSHGSVLRPVYDGEAWRFTGASWRGRRTRGGGDGGRDRGPRLLGQILRDG